MLTLEARPAPIAIEAERAAVLVVDMQNDFGAPGGMFDRAGIDITMIRRVIEPISRVLVAARRAHVPVIYLKMEHQPDLSDAGAADSPHRIKHGPFLKVKTTAPDGTTGRNLIKDTWNTKIIGELAPSEGDSRRLEAPLQRLLSNQLGRYAEVSRYQVPYRHRLYDQRLRGIHRSGRDVQGLFLCGARGLYG
jgi:ureidoacrylate peracid hydrolase